MNLREEDEKGKFPSENTPLRQTAGPISSLNAAP